MVIGKATPWDFHSRECHPPPLSHPGQKRGSPLSAPFRGVTGTADSPPPSLLNCVLLPQHCCWRWPLAFLACTAHFPSQPSVLILIRCLSIISQTELSERLWLWCRKTVAPVAVTIASITISASSTCQLRPCGFGLAFLWTLRTSRQNHLQLPAVTLLPQGLCICFPLPGALSPIPPLANSYPSIKDQTKGYKPQEPE